jgi:hypothetical protein
MALKSVQGALDADHGDGADADRLVAQAIAYVEMHLSSFTVQESLHGLGLNDRLAYMSILGLLGVLVSIGKLPSPTVARVQQLESQRQALMKLHIYLRAFNADLARVYARDSETQG